MRKRSKSASIVVVGLLTSATAVAGGVLTGCEDGPNQTFATAPANAGNLWNNGNPDASVANGAAKFDAQFGSIGALQHCTADEKRETWARMLEQPIIPPLRFAGLNLAYDQQFDGITLKEAEAINCTGNPLGPGGVSWGDNDEVNFFYTTSNYIVNQIELNLGYNGKMTFHQRVGAKQSDGTCQIASRFESSPTPDPHRNDKGELDNCGGHTYVLQLGQPILKDGVVLEVNWQDFGANTVVNEIFNGLMATFGADLVGGNVDDTSDCTQDGSCLALPPSESASNGGECFMGFLPLEGLIIETDCTTGTQPTVSVPNLMAQQYYLTEPYSFEASVATINAQGPVSLPRNAQDPQNCFVQLGMDWKTYIENCIELPGAAGTAIDPELADSGLMGDAGLLIVNTINKNKAYAAHQHSAETYNFNVVGVDIDWTDGTIELPQNARKILSDDDLPNVEDGTSARPGTAQAHINNWGTDLYDKGVPINDTTDASGTNFTGKGSAYVYREWARLTQISLNQQLAAAFPNRTVGGKTIFNHQIGDAACFVPPAAAYAAGCTGLEGLALQVGRGASQLGDPADDCGGNSAAPICANYTAGQYFAQLFGAPGYGATVLRPGDDLAIFCQNPATAVPGTDPLNGNCTYNATWQAALEAVRTVAGQGSLANLPQEVVDRRFYFRWYGIALIKYLKAYGKNSSATAVDIAAQTMDLESLFFDSQNDGGGSTYDNEEYIERSFMTNTPATYLGTNPGTPGAVGAVTVPAATNAVALDFSFGADTLAANQRSTEWTKFMFRQEAAMFTAMLENKSNLPGAENNVNITNLAGSHLLQQNYANYECATQYPDVTIPSSNGGAAITGPWETVCGLACPAFLYPLNCPTPPLLPATTPGATRSLQLDLNGSNPGIGLGGTTPRLAAYKAVWGRGAACVDPTINVASNAELDPTEVGNNPYSADPCHGFNNGAPVATGVGSVFAVGQRVTNASRLSYVGADATHPLTGTDQNTLTAFVNIPNMPNPNNAITLTGDPAPTVIQATVPWTPSYDGVGFTVPVDATRDKFFQTQQLDFGGVLMTYLLDVVPYADPITKKQDGTLTVEAIEGDDFLGEAFLCQDVGQFPTPGTGDLLGAHMYDSAASILSWITNHPGSEDSCQIIVRYSIYDNYIDSITSLTAGVQLDINTGNGYGRVVGIIAFDPSFSAAP